MRWDLIWLMTTRHWSWRLVLLLLAGFTLPHGAASARQAPAAIVIDANTGKTLYEMAPDARRYPASLAKMMTIYLVFERLKSGRLKMSSPIRFSRYAASQPPSKLGLEPGETITVRNALRALVTKSANDVASAVAEHIAGSEDAFARLMTKKAWALGMSQTRFRNASGLPDRRQLTTARDIAKLGLALQDNFPDRYRMFARRRFAFRGRRYGNHNKLLKNFRGTDGIKTGYTRASGFNLASSVRRDGKHVVGVVLGQRSGRSRNALMRSLLSKALAKASRRKTRRPQGAPRPQLIARPQLAPRPTRIAVARPRPSRVRDAAPRARQLARRPSTFGQQLAKLKVPEPRSVSSPSPKSPVNRSINRNNGLRRAIATHQVQIGAFFSEAEARSALSLAQSKAGVVLQGAQPLSVKVESRSRAFYRARFAGFDGRGASETCTRLKSLRVDCFVTRTN